MAEQGERWGSYHSQRVEAEKSGSGKGERERKEEGIELQVPCQMAHFSARALSLVTAEK